MFYEVPTYPTLFILATVNCSFWELTVGQYPTNLIPKSGLTVTILFPMSLVQLHLSWGSINNHAKMALKDFCSWRMHLAVKFFLERIMVNLWKNFTEQTILIFGSLALFLGIFWGNIEMVCANRGWILQWIGFEI